MFKRVITTNIRRKCHTHTPSKLTINNIERIKELEKIIESQSSTIKQFEFEMKKKYADGVWVGILSGMIVMFGLRILDDFVISERRVKKRALDMKNEIPPL
jgi:hypothetical protein